VVNCWVAPAAGFIQESTVGGPVRESVPLGIMRVFKSLSVAAESYRVQPFQKGVDSRQQNRNHRVQRGCNVIRVQ
jgi:hypothetical protein